VVVVRGGGVLMDKRGSDGGTIANTNEVERRGEEDLPLFIHMLKELMHPFGHIVVIDHHRRRESRTCLPWIVKDHDLASHMSIDQGLEEEGGAF